MSDEEEIVGSDFIGSDDEEKSVEALEIKLQKILQEKEKLENQKKKDELLSRIKQAEAALSNLQTSAEPSKSEIDSWTTEEIKQFFRRKGIIVKNKPLDHLRKLAKSIIDSRIPDHKTTAPSEISKRTINKNGTDLAFPYIKNTSLSNWSDDVSSLPSVEHVQAHAYILSSAEFDLDRFQNIQKEDSFLLYKGNAIKKIEIHKLDEGFCYVKCDCMSSQNSQTHLEVVWSLIRNDGCIHTAGCSCDDGNDCCKHGIALLLTLASLNKSNNYAVDKVQICDKGTKLYPNPSLTSLQHGKNGLPKVKYLGGEMKDSRGSKVFTYTSEGSLEVEEAGQDVWLPPTIIENKSATANRINESLTKQNDRSIPHVPVRKPQNNLAIHLSEPNTFLDPNANLQILKDKSTGDGTYMNQLQTKFEARLTKSPSEVETASTGKFSELSANNREMQLNSRIHHNIKEIEKPRQRSTEPKPLIQPRANVLSNPREQYTKKDRQETVGNIPFLQENILHSNTIKTTRNDGMIFKNISVKSDDMTFSHKPMPDSENLPVNTGMTTPSTSRSYPHTTSIEQTTVQKPVTPLLRSQLGLIHKYPLQVMDTQQKPISEVGYLMQDKSTAVPTDVSTYPTGQLPKPTSPYIYPQQTIASTVTPGYNPVYQAPVHAALVYPTDQHRLNSMSNLVPVSNYNQSQVIQNAQPGMSVPSSQTGYPYSSSYASFSTPLIYPGNETSNAEHKKAVDILDADNAHLLTNPDPLKPKVDRKGRFTAINLNQYFQGKKVSDINRPTPNKILTATKVNETSNAEHKKAVDILDADNAHLLTNPDPLKPKVDKKGRFTAINLNQYFQGKTVSDINRPTPNKILTATNAQRITYDRKFLMRLRKSVFSQRRPDIIDHFPEIQINSAFHEMPVTDRSFTFTPGYVKGTPKAMAPVTDKPAVRSKPKPKRTQSPAADAPPGVVSTQPQMTTEEIMRKAIGAINMVKHGCDASMVVKVISDLPINTEDALSRIVNLVVDTAVDDASCLSVCTSLCRVLARAKVQSRNDPGECVTFSMAYRQKCTKEIEQGILSRSTESHNRRIEEIARFTGSIARLILLKTSDIHAILMRFAQTKSEKCLECFCTLLTEVWERMEKCTSANYLDQYFEVIDEVLLYSETNAALKYKLGQLKSRQR